MRNRLCVLIQTVYSPKTPDYEQLTKEVNVDSHTVKEILSNHDILEIGIPSGAKRNLIELIVTRTLDNIRQNYEEAHIVLNTHGSPGSSDLPNEAVQHVLIGLSAREIKISQLSALQCDGMTVQSIQVQREAHPMWSGDIKLREKESMLVRLRNRLIATSTKITQHFKIYGVFNTYDPLEDRDLVVDILNGNSVDCLVVRTIMSSVSMNPTSLQTNINVIREIRDSGAQKGRAYDTAANCLAKVLVQIKKDLLTCLHENSMPSPSNKLFLKQLDEQAKAIEKSLDCSNFEEVFRIWMNKNSLTSEVRLSILEQFFHLLSSEPSDSLDSDVTRFPTAM